MTYRPQWDEGPGQGSFGGSGFGSSFHGWSVTKVLLWGCIGATLLGALVQLLAGSNYVSQWFGVGTGNFWLIFPMLTYVFPHSLNLADLHLIFNCLALAFLGFALEAEIGPRRFIGLFWGSALVGAVAQVLLQFALGGDIRLIGASGGVLGLLFYIAWATPDRPFVFIFVPVRARTLAYIYLVINIYPLLMDLGASSRVSQACHLGGALFGYLFWKFHWDPLVAPQAWLARQKFRRERQTASRSADRHLAEEAEMDRILAKISEQGIGSLSPGERKFLDERSRRLRERS